MGERKGTNHYYPPDYDPKKGGLNKFLGTHALRERARKIHMGILIIRFEMPYNIWCEGCGNHIGMGVRYNAEKKKIGMYYSTPVYQFRMKCHLCDNHFEIKTDPGNLDYVIVSGARRQENRWDPTQNSQVVPEDKETQKKLFDDAMFKLEHGEKDQGLGKKMIPVLGKLVHRNESSWKDDFAANSALRASFRAQKKELAVSNAKDKSLLQRSSLDIKLLPEHEDDIYMASLLTQTPSQSLNERQEKAREDIMRRPALPSCRPTMFLGTKAAKQLEEQNRNKLVLTSIVRSPVTERRSASSSAGPSSPCSSSTSDTTTSSKESSGLSDDEPNPKRLRTVSPTPNAGTVSPTLNAGIVLPTPNAGIVSPTPNAGTASPTPNAGTVSPTPNAGTVSPTPNAERNSSDEKIKSLVSMDYESSSSDET